VLNKLVMVMQPRDYQLAAKVVCVLSLVAAGVTAVFAAVAPNNAGVASVAFTVVIAGIVALLGWRVRRVRVIHPLAWAVLPFATIAIIVALDFLTADGSVSAQVFFFFPVLYGAAELRRRGAIAVTAAALIGELAVVVRWLPIRDAAVSVGYVGAVLVTTMLLLLTSAERQEELVDRLSRQAAVDPLTGLVTRRVLDQAAKSALTGAANHEGTALMLLDVDGFKKINDEFGHPAGDEVLVQLGRVLVGVCRPNDVVSRLGGDEIALLLVGCTGTAMTARAEQVLETIRAFPFMVNDGQQIELTVSAGLAHAPTHADDLRRLYSVADEALYRAKRAGRDQFALPKPPATDLPAGGAALLL
jgi:diguanylate cyclase (GGDEF)-like protein